MLYVKPYISTNVQNNKCVDTTLLKARLALLTIAHHDKKVTKLPALKKQQQLRDSKACKPQ